MTERKSNRHRPFSRADQLFMRIHRELYSSHRGFNFFLSVAVYIGIVLIFGHRLGISSNYFVLIPVVMGSICFGFAGGLVVGILGLPMNLILFELLGHMEFSPESKLIAEVFGISAGVFLGYFSDYFFKLQHEIQKRQETEEHLREALRDREVLLREVHHRVKNNLNIIKSLVQLQLNRSDNEEFSRESEKLIQRIYSISLVHEQLFSQNFTSSIPLTEYIRELVSNVALSLDGRNVKIDFRFEEDSRTLCMEDATPCGLIVNEVLTNCLKYAFPGIQNPEITVSVAREDQNHLISIADNGVGFQPREGNGNGLGRKLIAALVSQLGGTSEYSPNPVGGTVFSFRFPDPAACRDL